MPTRGEQLFQDLQQPSEIRNLIGQSEDVHFDCKEWPSKEEDAQKVLAKAVCGLTNADGGVLVIGMRARAISKDEPDLVESAAPVADTRAVKSRILDLIGQLVEPGVEGVLAAEVNESPDSKSGFVLVYVPECDGFPRRSRKDWKFYLRIGSGTFPMEYFQIAEMFAQRPRPNLELVLEVDTIRQLGQDKKPHQFLWLRLRNTGRGIAKFPSVRWDATEIGAYEYGIDGNRSVGLPRRPSEPPFVVFRGGVDDVIYPGATLTVTRLVRPISGMDINTDQKQFKKTLLVAEVSCEGMQTKRIEDVFNAFRLNED